jgi:hypothetical protein
MQWWHTSGLQPKRPRDCQCIHGTVCPSHGSCRRSYACSHCMWQSDTRLESLWHFLVASVTSYSATSRKRSLQMYARRLLHFNFIKFSAERAVSGATLQSDQTVRLGKHDLRSSFSFPQPESNDVQYVCVPSLRASNRNMQSISPCHQTTTRFGAIIFFGLQRYPLSLGQTLEINLAHTTGRRQVIVHPSSTGTVHKPSARASHSVHCSVC